MSPRPLAFARPHAPRRVPATTSVVVALALVAGLLLALTPSAAARPSPVCTNVAGASSCPGVACADRDLDAKWDAGECIIVYCLHGCCGGPCPPPRD